MMAVLRRNPRKQVLVRLDKGRYYTNHEWQPFLKSHGMEGNMNRRGNCHYYAVTERFFQLFKCERIKNYGTREEAHNDIFHIEIFHKSRRPHNSSY
ncbi:hypothetical protein ARC310_19800 [Pantoea ananatis]|nr:hypothetical protein ARC310_19800 [Pantoea ananatis]PZD64337.1 hypothetical protein ARC311_11880 [Pantoea ananatis]